MSVRVGTRVGPAWVSTGVGPAGLALALVGLVLWGAAIVVWQVLRVVAVLLTLLVSLVIRKLRN